MVRDMWKLKCDNNGQITEKVVKFKNIIGRDQVRSFFADNGYAMMDCEMESITYMQAGETLQFYFPNKVKYIEVVAL
jgi:hypothetical protein